MMQTVQTRERDGCVSLLRGLCGLVFPSRTSERGGEVPITKLFALLLFITAPNIKLCVWGKEDSGGHVL